MIIIDFTKRKYIETPHSALCAIEQLWSQMKTILLPNDNGNGMRPVLATYYEKRNESHSERINVLVTQSVFE